MEAKELVGHGEWLPWLQANCRVGERQARTYMRLARHRHRLESAVTADLTIAAAEALVGKPKPECEHGLPGQLDFFGEPVVADPAPEWREIGRLRTDQPPLSGPGGMLAVMPPSARGCGNSANHSTEIYWFAGSAAAVAMYFE
jgi:Protein of unknown function (DUF3102)